MIPGNFDFRKIEKFMKTGNIDLGVQADNTLQIFIDQRIYNLKET